MHSSIQTSVAHSLHSLRSFWSIASSVFIPVIYFILLRQSLFDPFVRPSLTLVPHFSPFGNKNHISLCKFAEGASEDPGWRELRFYFPSFRVSEANGTRVKSQGWSGGEGSEHLLILTTLRFAPVVRSFPFPSLGRFTPCASVIPKNYSIYLICSPCPFGPGSPLYPLEAPM